MTRLSQIPLGKKVVVTGISHDDRALQQKLLALGVVEGAELEVSSRAIFSGPLRVKARSFASQVNSSAKQVGARIKNTFELSLRIEEAGAIFCQVC